MLSFYKRQYILPDNGVTFKEQLNNCFKQLEEIYQNNYFIQLTFFINTQNNAEYLEKKSLIFNNLKNVLEKIPSISIIGQLPDSKDISAEIVYVAKNNFDFTIEYKNYKGIIYTVIQSDNEIEIFAGGISSNNLLDGKRTEQAEEAFKLMEKILSDENLTFAEVVRQWNYIEDIIGFEDCYDKKLQNYQVLNDVRSKYYSRANFINGFPAATGIGMNTGGVILEFYARKTKQKVIPIKNPQQNDAYEYSQDVLIGNGLELKNHKTSPKFERAKFIFFQNSKRVFISGTASIKKEQTLGIDDIEMQTKITIENIENLVSDVNLKANKILNNHKSANYSFIRVYVKNPDYMEQVKKICNTFFLNTQINYLIADICRENLLVEIEGELELN